MNYLELKELIIKTLNKDVKNADDLLAVCAWSLSKAKRLCQEIHEERSEADCWDGDDSQSE